MMSRSDIATAPISMRTTLKRPATGPTFSPIVAWRSALGEIAVLGERGEHRHEVRLAGAVVADDQQTLVVLWRVVTEMRQHDVADLLGHPVRDDVRLDQAARLLGGICLTKLDDRLDRIELKKLSVLHRWFPSAMRWSADGPAWTMIAGTSV